MTPYHPLRQDYNPLWQFSIRHMGNKHKFLNKSITAAVRYRYSEFTYDITALRAEPPVEQAIRAAW